MTLIIRENCRGCRRHGPHPVDAPNVCADCLASGRPLDQGRWSDVIAVFLGLFLSGGFFWALTQFILGVTNHGPTP